MEHGEQPEASLPGSHSLAGSPLASASACSPRTSGFFTEALRHSTSLILQPVTVPATGPAPVGQAPISVGRGQGVCRS